MNKHLLSSAVVSVTLALYSMLISCAGQDKSHQLWNIDTDESYPTKILDYQELGSVSYVPLETDSVVYDSSRLPDYSSSRYLGYIDNASGNVILFDALTGERKISFNRKGTGPEEYLMAGSLFYDENNHEIFVWNFMEGCYKVYGEGGDFRRNLPLRNYRKGEFMYATATENYNDSLMLCSSSHHSGYSIHYLMNKRNGSSILIDSIPADKVVKTAITSGTLSASVKVKSLDKGFNRFVYSEPSLDTLYAFSEYDKMVPILCQTPSAGSTDPARILRFDGETSRWLFVSVVEISFDFETQDGFAERQLGIDKESGTVYEVQFRNRDWKDYVQTSYHKCILLENEDLKDALDEGLLSGELKKAAEKIDMEGNGILVKIE